MILIVLASYLHLEVKVSAGNRLTPSLNFPSRNGIQGTYIVFQQICKRWNVNLGSDITSDLRFHHFALLKQLSLLSSPSKQTKTYYAAHGVNI